MAERIVFCSIREEALEGRSITALRFSRSGKRSALNEVQGHKNIGKLERRSAECNGGS